MSAKKLSVQQYVDGVLSANRATLAQTITLIESRRPAHQTLAAEVLAQLVPHSGESIRLGVTGVPGVGKSTFIDQFGSNLLDADLKVAVLAVDPTSSRTGGSILGDKTRMERLAVHDFAFVRPTPAGTTLGGVAKMTRETMLVCEAAGFDVVVVETVGVGQSETVVEGMVDFFLVLMLAGAGDELQGIKKGILEMADAVVVNKADGDNITRCERAAADYRHALHLLEPATPTWSPPVMCCSALQNAGLHEIWEQITSYRNKLSQTGELVELRQDQQVQWMWSLIDDRLMDAFVSNTDLSELVDSAERDVRAGEELPTSAATRLLSAFFDHTG